jgi:hypothetical protein
MWHIYLDDKETIETIILTWLKTVLSADGEGEGPRTGCGCWMRTTRWLSIGDGCTTWFKWRREEEEEVWWNISTLFLQVDKLPMMEVFELHHL